MHAIVSYMQRLIVDFHEALEVLHGGVYIHV